MDEEIYDTYRKKKGEAHLSTLRSGQCVAYDVIKLFNYSQMNGVGKYQESMELCEGLLKCAREFYGEAQITSDLLSVLANSVSSYKIKTLFQKLKYPMCRVPCARFKGSGDDGACDFLY